jgi:uncharacterized membrane protein
MWTTWTKVNWSLMTLGALLLVLFAARYYAFDPEVYFERQRAVYEAKTLGLMVHISGMMFAAVLGPFQFLRSFRERHFKLHRLTGKVYLTGAVVGALGGLYMAQYSASGTVSDVGFMCLGVGVLVTSAAAYLRIRGRDVQGHREWMTRSYALIFAAVTLRLYLPGLEALFGEQDGYAAVAWACWLPNLVVAEWLIRSRFRQTPAAALAVI